jgi:hypothetical protein
MNGLNVKKNKTKYTLFRLSTAYSKIINEHIYINGIKVDRISQNEKS